MKDVSLGQSTYALMDPVALFDETLAVAAFVYVALEPRNKRLYRISSTFVERLRGRMVRHNNELFTTLLTVLST